MRFYQTEFARKSKLGDIRTLTWFALFPVTIKNETRWLEMISVLYEYRVIEQDHETGNRYGWVKTNFANK